MGPLMNEPDWPNDATPTMATAKDEVNEEKLWKGTGPDLGLFSTCSLNLFSKFQLTSTASSVTLCDYNFEQE